MNISTLAENLSQKPIYDTTILLISARTALDAMLEADEISKKEYYSLYDKVGNKASFLDALNVTS